MNITKSLREYSIQTLSVSALILAGCAPSGGESNASDTMETGPTTQTEAPMQVERDFDLSSSQNVAITVTSTTTSEAYLSICREKDSANGVGVEIDYENCIVRTRMENGQYNGDFKLPPHYERLYAALWFFDLTNEPIISEITRDEMLSGEINIDI